MYIPLPFSLFLNNKNTTKQCILVLFKPKSNRNKKNGKLGGGFTYFLFSPLFGEDSQFD